MIVKNKCLVFGENIKNALEKASKSVAELALDTGLDESLIKSAVSGNEEICEKLDSNDIIKIASALNVEESELFSF